MQQEAQQEAQEAQEGQGGKGESTRLRVMSEHCVDMPKTKVEHVSGVTGSRICV
jgi:hypothetical protein